MRRARPFALGALLALAAGAAHAQGQGKQESPWTGSVRAATIQFNDSTSLGALGGVIEYRALDWLRLGAAPTLVRATTGSTATSGFGDLPLALEAASRWGTPLHPELGASLIVLVPTGQAACGLGNGTTSVGMSLGAGLQPTEALHLSAEASRSFSGAITLSSLDQPQATWVDFDGDVDVAPRWTLSLSVGGNVGGADTGTADREVGAGMSYALSGALDLSVDVTHRVAGQAPRWGLAVGLGTATSGSSSLNSLSPVGRARQVVVGGATNRRHGAPTPGTGSSTCP